MPKRRTEIDRTRGFLAGAELVRARDQRQRAEVLALMFFATVTGLVIAGTYVILILAGH